MMPLNHTPDMCFALRPSRAKFDISSAYRLVADWTKMAIPFPFLASEALEHYVPAETNAC